MSAILYLRDKNAELCDERNLSKDNSLSESYQGTNSDISLRSHQSENKDSVSEDNSVNETQSSVIESHYVQTETAMFLEIDMEKGDRDTSHCCDDSLDIVEKIRFVWSSIPHFPYMATVNTLFSKLLVQDFPDETGLINNAQESSGSVKTNSQHHHVTKDDGHHYYDSYDNIEDNGDTVFKSDISEGFGSIKNRKYHELKLVMTCDTPGVKVSGKMQRHKKICKLLGVFEWLRYFQPEPVRLTVFPGSRLILNKDSQETATQGPVNEGRTLLLNGVEIPWTYFRHELFRLGSFAEMPPNSPVFAVRLAQAGFVRLSDGGIVCYFCGLRRDEWRSGESPLEVHRRERPDCSLMARGECDNQPVTVLGAEQLEQLMVIWSLSGPPLLPARHPILPSRPPPLPSVSALASSRPVTTVAGPSPGSLPITAPRPTLQSADITHDGSPSISQPSQPSDTGTLQTGLTPYPTATARPQSAASPGSTNQAANGQAPASTAISQPSSQATGPRLGLLGGSATTTNPPVSAPSLADSAQSPPARSPGDGSSGVPRRPGQQVVTYQQLGIVTEVPKRADMTTMNARVGSYRDWSSANSHTPLRLSEAGFYFAGYADCSRCFFCGGGLKNWEPADDPWVEHARWFPKCAYVKQCQGQEFIDMVQELNSSGQAISVNQVKEEIQRRRADGERLNDPVTDPAIGCVLELGYSQEAIDSALQSMQRDGHLLTVDRLMDSLQAEGSLAAGGGPVPDASDAELADIASLASENSEIRQTRMCKICLDKEVCVVFLPCGHLVCCATCSPALRHCPMCRQTIKGRVRAFPT